MKTLVHILLTITFLLSITACSNSDNNESNINNNPPQNQAESNETPSDQTFNDNSHDQNNAENHTNSNLDDDDSEMSQEEIIRKIAKQEVTSFPFDLPMKLPVDEGKHITGITNSKEGYFEVIFYQTTEQMPPNDDRIKEENDKIARLQIQAYDSEEAANKEISFENYAEIGGEEIDLGHIITGYQDAGAGSVFTSWNEGRWALTSRARTQNSEDGVMLAKEAVTYLETHVLPPPEAHGKVQLDTKANGSLIKWQKGKNIYTINQVQKPLHTLKIAVAFPSS